MPESKEAYRNGWGWGVGGGVSVCRGVVGLQLCWSQRRTPRTRGAAAAGVPSAPAPGSSESGRTNPARHACEGLGKGVLVHPCLMLCSGSAIPSVPVFRIIMILAASLAACQDLFGQNPDRIRIFKRVFAQDLPRNPGKCTTVTISRPEGAEIMSGQNFPSRLRSEHWPYPMPPRTFTSPSSPAAQLRDPSRSPR